MLLANHIAGCINLHVFNTGLLHFDLGLSLVAACMWRMSVNRVWPLANLKLVRYVIYTSMQWQVDMLFQVPVFLLWAPGSSQ